MAKRFYSPSCQNGNGWGDYYEDDINICKRSDDDDAVSGLKTVTALQTGLTKLKYKMVTDSGVTVIVDGQYGTGTRNALKQFLADNGLPGDGESFFADANAVMTMMLTLALGRVRQKQPDLMRSLVRTA